MFKSKLVCLLSAFTLAAVFCEGVEAAQAPTLITSTIDEGKRVAVAHSIYPMARSEFDQGPAPDNLPLERMLLVLKRSPDRQAALDRFLEQLQEPSSPNYHKWLTPEEFGQQFGASDDDIQVVTSWLQSHGFQVQPVPAGRGLIEFSGNAGGVRNTFHTEIHKFTVKGVDHWANASDQQIPAALADAVAGVATLHNFLSAPQSSIINAHVSPEYTYSSGSHYLAPGDYAAIYNVNPLYPTITGAGTSIAVVGRTNINVQDVVSFRSLFGLPANPPNIMVNGTNPGDLGGGEEAEAVLDTSWAGALATAATVDLVVSASTATTDGVYLSEVYIINNNLSNVMTESFGLCEANFTSAQETVVSSNAQQAAAEGISYTVAAGDSGSAGCDADTEPSATQPIAVNGLASTPYDVAVGGTQFNENGNYSLYWSSTNAANYSSALSYIPEDVWNANCTGAVCGTGSILAGGGGASAFFAKPSWQKGVAGIPADGARDLPDVSLTAAGNDPYLLCLDGSCSGSPPSMVAVYGTSASTPSFASIIALLNQKAGSRLGQLTPRLYALAATENLSACNASNTAGLPAATCIFNDITIGTNAVPGEPNYNTSSETYPAGVGYDRASGLGSVNVANLVNNWNVTLVAEPIASVSPASLTFAAQTDGTTSAAQILILSNTGSASLGIASIAFSGVNASDFAESNGCGSALAMGAKCSISVTFTPAAGGSATASLVVTDNSGNVTGSTQTMSLSGTGAVATTSSATYSGADTTTLGTWTGHYGADGQLIANDVTNAPTYATVSFTGDSTYTWQNPSSDPRALQVSSGSSTRIASTYYSSAGFDINVNLTDGKTHKISVYLLDWENAGRSETISIVDAASKTVLSTQKFSAFSGGIYETWNVRGNVQIQVVFSGGNNAVVAGVFFDTPSSVTSSATYTGADTTTLGTWTGHYGADGQLIANDVTNAPSYATAGLTGDSTYTWQNPSSDPRALQVSSGSSTRIASTYYSSASFDINVNLTDGNTHKISLYLLDWENARRSETISIVDAASKTVLSTQKFSAFSGGVYATWNVKGNVQIQVVFSGGNNAVVAGVFFN